MDSIHIKGGVFKSLKLMLIVNQASTYCNYGFNTLSKRTAGPDNVALAQIRYSPGTSQCLSETCFTRVAFTTGPDHYDQRIKMWAGLWQNNGSFFAIGRNHNVSRMFVQTHVFTLFGYVFYRERTNMPSDLEFDTGSTLNMLSLINKITRFLRLMKLKIFLHRQTRSSQMQLVLSCEFYPSSFIMFSMP